MAEPSSKKELRKFGLTVGGVFLLHVPLLQLPYFWDEAGYYVPAARDLLLGLASCFVRLDQGRYHFGFNPRNLGIESAGLQS